MQYEIPPHLYDKINKGIKSIETFPGRIPANAYRLMALMAVTGALAVNDHKETQITMGSVEPIFVDGRPVGKQYNAETETGRKVALYNESVFWQGKGQNEIAEVDKDWRPGETRTIKTTRWSGSNILKIK